MLINELTATECQESLARASFGRLACAKEGEPYIVPIYFAYEGGHLYGFSTFGRKVEWMRSNPRVCVEIDDVPNYFRWTSVIASGRYEELPDEPEHSAAREHARMLLEERFLWWQTAYAAMQLRTEPQSEPPVFYCIHIESVTGRKATPDPVEAYVGLDSDPRAKY